MLRNAFVECKCLLVRSVVALDADVFEGQKYFNFTNALVMATGM
jgi:hypothetical protein